MSFDVDAHLREAQEEMRRQGSDADSTPQGDRRTLEPAPAQSEEALALSFAERHECDLRYVAKWKIWLVWDGKRWKPDDSLQAFDFSRATCREAARGERKSAREIASAKTVAAVERLAKADRRLAATPDQFDADPWLLNTPSGILDLRTGMLRPQAQTDYLTKVTGIGPAPPRTPCPRFRRFLQEIMGDDDDLVAFLQRAFGYSLTGMVTEHALFFACGKGANGKGTLLNTFTRILGDYAAVANAETFTVSHADRHPTDLAMLRGARFVTVQEVEEGRRWAESKIKALTGGDPITARFMRADFFTFDPQLKLWIAANHRPGLRNIDEAIRRRLHLIRFDVTIPPAARDRDLPERLKAEWPAILRWAIDGCLQWQQGGLRPPEAVRAATEEYLDAEDALARWLADCAYSSADGPFESNADLFASWKAWAERCGEYVGSEKRLTQALEDRGFRRMRQGKARTRGFAGIRLSRRSLGEDR